MREHWQPADDWLPPRLLTERLPSGVVRGVGLDPGELRDMIQGYYRARGWDDTGFVPAGKMASLGIPL